MTQRLEHVRLRLVGGDEDIDTDLVRREFPTVDVERAIAAAPGDIVVQDHAWRGAFDLGSFDEKVEQARPSLGIAVRGYDATNIACEVMTRYQRLFPRRNRASEGALFEAVLGAHAERYELSKPHLKAEFDHALDTWQWVLRLSPEIGLAPQIAALFHEVERKSSDPRDRIEHRVPDGQALRDVAVIEVVDRCLARLERIGVDANDLARVREVAFAARRPSTDPEVNVLDDADALSFLSLHSAEYIDYFGVAQTRRKVAFTLSRLGPIAREKLERVRLRPDVERLLREVAA